MPFRDYDDQPFQLGLADGIDMNPDPKVSQNVGLMDTMGAAMRQENPVVSGANQYRIDKTKPFDPNYRVWDDIQGTPYEPYAMQFVDARDEEDVQGIKAQLDQEMEDRATLDAAGPWGVIASMGAAILSPTTLLPGGALVKGAKGVSIARTAANVGAYAAIAATADELMLHNSQRLRTPQESAMAIGGSVILGGLLGGGIGSLSKAQHARSSAAAAALPAQIQEIDRAMQSLSAASTAQDLTLRRERLFQAINAVPGLRGLVRSDPILRAQISPNTGAREALVDLVETPLQYEAGGVGQTVGRFDMPAETAIKTRRNTELVGALQTIEKQYADYVFDGNVGMTGRITAPVVGRWSNLTNADGKYTRQQFEEQVGIAAMSNDIHPIPQVQTAAQEMRKQIFDRIKDEMIEVGMVDEGIQVKYGDSYFMRVYNQEKIRQHQGDGSDLDMKKMLDAHMRGKREEAQNRLAFDRTVDELEADRFRERERARTAQTAFNKARRKLTDKRERARAAVGRENAVGRATGALRKLLQARSDDLASKLLTKDERASLREAVMQARGADRLAPMDLLSVVRKMGGVKDDGSGELQSALDTAVNTVKRKDGLNADDMRGALEEFGYLDEGSTEADFWQALRDNAQGEPVYSRFDAEQVENMRAAQEFASEMASMGIDINAPLDDIIKALPGRARNPQTTRAKSQEAGRSADQAGKRETGAEAAAVKAIERLENAQAALKEFDEVVGPKVKEEIKEAQDALKQIIPELKKAKAARAEDDYFANLDDLEIKAAVDDTVDAILGLKPGEHWTAATSARPTRARVLDVHDRDLLPWLNTNITDVISQYSESLIPRIEITRRFGDTNLTGAKRRIQEEGQRQKDKAKGARARTRIQTETEERINDLQGMADRMMGIYGVPENPNSVWVRGGRAARIISYLGLLGGVTISALPDAAGIIGRNGLEAAFGGMQMFKNPQRFTKTLKDSYELGGAAEWYLNGRMQSVFELAGPYGRGSKFEQAMSMTSTAFSVANGMLPWNVAMKTIGGAFVSSKISKAAVAVADGKATKAQLRKLAENGIDTVKAQRIAEQIRKHADTSDMTWLPQARLWDDPDAYEAFRAAMNREMDLMVITPGQDKPLSFSNEVGKFFSQFKTFALSANHRILLSGMQRADGAVLSQFLLAFALGMMVSKIKAKLGGFPEKEGNDLYVDALDRSGLTGFLFDVYAPANALAGGRLGPAPSRFQSRSTIQGAFGPSADMAINGFEALSAMSAGNMTERDVRNLMRYIPGNNLPYIVDLTKSVAASAAQR